MPLVSSHRPTMTDLPRTVLRGTALIILAVTLANACASDETEPSPAAVAPSGERRPDPPAATPQETVAQEVEPCGEPSGEQPEPWGPPRSVPDLRVVLVFEFPEHFGGMYINPDGPQTLLYVDDYRAIERYIQGTGLLSGPLALQITYWETGVSLAELLRCKVMLEQDPVLAPGIVVVQVGIRDSDSSLSINATGNLAIAKELLRTRLGPDQAFRLDGPPIEQ